MFKFIKQIFIFFLAFGMIFLVGIFLPVTPKAKSNMLAYKPEKDKLLIVQKEPRIIFIGGSNLVFGLNSQMIKDSLQMNPVNLGMAASIGMIYMIDDALPDIKEGDIVVLASEYHSYFGNQAYGGHDLFRLLMDVERSGFENLRMKHFPNLVKSVPIYFMSKFKYYNYYFDGESDVYGKHIFNQYGDSDFHWGLEKREFHILNPIRGKFNQSILNEILEFDKKLNERGATLMVTFPCCQQSSLDAIEENVKIVDRELQEADLIVLGDSKRYGFPDSLMFDTPWHLTKEGVDLRTNYLIEDIRGKLKTKIE